MTKTKKTFAQEAEDHLICEGIRQNLNRNTLMKHHPTVPSLLVPMYDPVRPEIMNPKNVLAAGSTITLGLTDEQKDDEKKWELERRRIATVNLQMEERDRAIEGKSSLAMGLKAKSVADKLKMFSKTNKYIAKYETILQEREEEEKRFKSRKKRFQTIQGVASELKETLIRAAYPRGGDIAYKLMGDSKAVHRKSDSLRQFSVQPEHFSAWSQHLVDHMSKVHPTWRQLLHWLAKTDDRLDYAFLQNPVLGLCSEDAVELSQKLEQVLVDWLPEKLYLRRAQLAGGKRKEGNGFAVWRRLHRDNTGEGDILQYAGTQCLREYGRCTKLTDVSTHIDGWYNSSMCTAPSWNMITP